jgi:sirohydrochlorin ferrochelatase
MAQVTDEVGHAVLVAHGHPSDPEPQEVAMQALAASVARQLPGWTIRGVTLAKAGSLESALCGLDDPVVYPFFMADGVFTGHVLPERLRQTGKTVRQLPPFGTDQILPSLIAHAVHDSAISHGLRPAETKLVIAAHGSKTSSTSKHTALELTGRLAVLTSFSRIVVGFIEEAPFLADAARGDGPGLCLPFFALRAGHVESDVPQALAKAGFSGHLLPPIGEHPTVPRLVADALARTQQRVAA